MCTWLSTLLFRVHTDIVLFEDLITSKKSHYCCKNVDVLKYEIPSNTTLVGTDSEYKFTLSEIEFFHV